MRGKRILYLWPLGSPGGTETLLKKCLSLLKEKRKRPYEKTLYITPTEEKINYVKDIISDITEEQVILPPRLKTLDSLAEDIAIKYFKLRESKNIRRISDRERLLILYRILWDKREEIEHLLPPDGTLSLSFVRNVIKFMRNVREYLPKENLSEIEKIMEGELSDYPEVWERVQTLLNILKEYREFLYARDLVDKEEVYLWASREEALRESEQPRILILDGFTDFTERQKDLLLTLMKLWKGTNVIFLAYLGEKKFNLLDEQINFIKSLSEWEIHSNIKIPPPEKEVRAYISPEAETTGIFRECKKILLNENSTKIIVIFSNTDYYRPLFERALLNYGLPAFISKGVPLRVKPPFKLVLTLIKTVADGYPRQGVVQVISSPYLNFPERVKKLIDPLSRIAGIVKGKEEWEFIGKRIRTCEDIPEGWEDLRGEADYLEKNIKKFLKYSENLEGVKTLEEHNRSLIEFLKKFNFPMGKDEEGKIEERLAGILSDLEEMESLCGKLEIDPLQYYRFLYGLLSEEDKPDRSQMDKNLLILTLPEAITLDADYIFFGGLTDDHFPVRPEEDPFLPDRVKRRLGLPHLDREFERQEIRFEALKRGARKKVYLSYPKWEGDSLLIPSIFIEDEKSVEISLREEPVVYPLSYSEFHLREGLLKGYDFLVKIEAITDSPKFLVPYIEKKYGADVPLNVTLLEEYKRCPYLFLHIRILGLTPVEEPSYEPQLRTIGTWLHSVMEKLYRGGKFLKDKLEERIRGVSEEVSAEFGLGPFWSKYLEHTLKRNLNVLRELEEKEEMEGFRPYVVEKKLKLKVKEGIELIGKIDRADISDKCFRIIDYKSGGLSTLSDIKNGYHLQLPIYVVMMGNKLKDKVFDGAALFGFKQREVYWILGAMDKGLIEESIKRAIEYTDSIRSALFPPEPKDRNRCYFCSVKGVCPRWVLKKH
jgi:ATP-dependent helicase/DNAse subunit B